MFALSLSVVFTAVVGSASEFRTLALRRFIASVAGAPLITTVVGILNDLWNVVNAKTGTTFMDFFAAMMIWGTEIGPPIGESIYRDTGDWRWTFWLRIIIFGASCVTWLCLETYGPAIVRRRAKDQGRPVPPRGSILAVIKVSLGRPIHMLFTEPIIFPTSLISAIGMCAVFFFYVVFPLVFERQYSFTQYQAGLTFLSLFIGSVLGLVILSAVDKRTYRAAKKKAEALVNKVAPEERLYPVMLGGLLLPLSLFWSVFPPISLKITDRRCRFAWTAKPSIHGVVPLLSGIPFGMGSFLTLVRNRILCSSPLSSCFDAILTLVIRKLDGPMYKNGVYGIEYGVPALAAENFIRYILAAPSRCFPFRWRTNSVSM